MAGTKSLEYITLKKKTANEIDCTQIQLNLKIILRTGFLEVA